MTNRKTEKKIIVAIPVGINPRYKIANIDCKSILFGNKPCLIKNGKLKTEAIKSACVVKDNKFSTSAFFIIIAPNE